MNGINLTDAKASKLISLMLGSQSEEYTIEGVTAQLKFELDTIISGVKPDNNGILERVPKQSQTHKDLQNDNTYFTVLLKRAQGVTTKTWVKNIFKNNAPELHALIKNSVDAMAANNGVFAEIALTGVPVQIFNCVYDKPFYIKNTGTKSGFSEDKRGIPVPNFNRQLVLFPDFENIQTEVRREIRNLEYNGEFAASSVDMAVNTNTEGQPVNNQIPNPQGQPTQQVTVPTGTQG